MGVTVREKPRGSGVWWIFVNHKNRRKAKKVGRNEKRAREVAEKYEAMLALGDSRFLKNEEKPCPTLKQYVEGWEDKSGGHPGWLETFAAYSLKNSTRFGYKASLRNHILPAFGSLPLNEITSRRITEYVYGLYKKKNLITKNETLRSNTVKNIKICLSSILNDAKKNGYIETNPAKGIEVAVPENEQPSREANPFTWEERDHFELTFKKECPRYYPLVLCGLRTGLRMGELIALQWGDIDFVNKVIFVHRNITRFRVTTPKSKSSIRMVRMTSQLKEILEKHRQGVMEEKLRRGWKEMPEWVFVNEEGSYLHYSHFLQRFWNKVMKRSGLIRRTPHDMRHTYATLRLSKGDSIAEVSKEMGHSKPDITFKTYYKWIPSQSRTNIDELDNHFKTQPAATHTQPARISP